MLPDAGPHAGFIWAAYGVAAAVFIGLTTYATVSGRVQRRLLRRLEGGDRR